MNLLTKRIPTILGLLVLISCIFGLYYYFQYIGKNIEAGISPEKVRITNIADNKFNISWTTEIATSGLVEYGKVGEKLAQKQKDDRDTTSTKGEYTTHYVTVEGLQPSTQYAFRILSGEESARFDNSGSPYTVATGPVIGETPASQNFYGNVEQANKQPANNALVYVTLPGGATTSTLVTEAGNYVVTLSTIRASDLRSYVKYDPTATIVSMTVESGKQQSIVSVTLANSMPVPTVTLGQDTAFLTAPEAPVVAEVIPENKIESAPELPTIFNVEPLVESPDINVVNSETVSIINPKENGETLATLRPEFRGTGPKGSTISIALSGQKSISDTVLVATDGTWSWTPVIDLKSGKQKITISYLNSASSTQKIEREFNISTAKIGVDPAFVSSPSASVATLPTSTASASATPRTAMPDTSSGTPVTGVIENTILVASIGILFLLTGGLILLL